MPNPKPRPSETVHMDDWQNVLTALGTSKDKRGSTEMAPPVKWSRGELMDLYRGSDLVGTLVDLPADEMMREGFTVKVDDDPDHEDNATIMDYLDGSDDGEQQGLDVSTAVYDLLRWADLFGGAGLILGVADGQSSEKPINFAKIQSVDFLNVLDRYTLRPYRYYSDPLAPKFGQPEIYQIVHRSTYPGQALESKKAYRYIHESRVIYQHGVKLPAEDMALENDGAGDSVVTRVWETIRDYAHVWMSFAYLLGDYAHTFVRIKGLRDALTASDGKAIIQARMEAIEMCRSIARMVLLDENEEFGREVVSLAGMPEAMQKFVERLAQAARMPIELLMGQPPGGINGNGETGMRYWHAKIKAAQKKKVRPILQRIIRPVLAAKKGPTGGRVPEKWCIEFNPLWAQTDAEKAEIYGKVATAAASLAGAEIVDRTELANSHFGSGKLSLDVKLDKRVRDAVEANALEALENPPDPVEQAAAMAAAKSGGKVPPKSEDKDKGQDRGGK
jgi:phage-related protein (TIGR01555 family)